MPDSESAAPKSGIIDRLTTLIGNVAAWLSILMAVITAAVVVMRYAFGEGSIALQESIFYLHSAIFMLGAAYALHCGAHVRVDVFYQRFSPCTQAWVNAIGGVIFLLPLCGFITLVSWEFVVNAWHIKEVSPDAGGLPFVFLLKTLIPILGVTLALQGLADISRQLSTLSRHYGDNQHG
ncbi:MAG: TRAP transporter small permease subunit [Pseudomonadales bacterium]